MSGLTDPSLKPLGLTYVLAIMNSSAGQINEVYVARDDDGIIANGETGECNIAIITSDSAGVLCLGCVCTSFGIRIISYRSHLDTSVPRSVTII